MKLDFRLLVVDDSPDTIRAAIGILRDHLDRKGFSLVQDNAPDLSPVGLQRFTRRSGKDFDLVMIDYNLGRQDINGAVAASQIRTELQFTDIVFYSSDRSLDLLRELASRNVAGVFVASRQELSDALVGLADTVIGKAVDLNHMRGIAMAQVAEMDVMMEEVLTKVFSTSDPAFAGQAQGVIDRLVGAAKGNTKRVEKFTPSGILDIVTDGRVFSLFQKVIALKSAAKCMKNVPVESLATLESYDEDIIQSRNTLAHAKENVDAGGTVTLRSIQRGGNLIVIDDDWMTQFRNKLRGHGAALGVVCHALRAHVDTFNAGSNASKS